MYRKKYQVFEFLLDGKDIINDKDTLIRNKNWQITTLFTYAYYLSYSYDSRP